MNWENLGVVGLVAVVILFIIACFVAVPFILMLAWNFVMPKVFGLPELNIWTAIALCVICSILFGGIKVVSSK